MSKIITDSNTHYDRFLKPLVQRLIYKKGPQSIVYIFGVQRSGTTLLTHLYNQLRYARVYGEFSPLNQAPCSSNIRLNTPDNVYRYLQRCHAPLVVMKPLVESQHARHWLALPGSSAVWMYRHYLDVAASSIKKFSQTNGLYDIAPMLERCQHNWRSEGMSDTVYHTLHQLVDKHITAHEAACLFWYARNALFFEQNLSDTRTVLLHYRQLQQHPHATMSALLKHHGSPISLNDVSSTMFKVVDKRGRRHSASDIPVRPHIRHVCDALYDKLKASAVNIGPQP